MLALQRAALVVVAALGAAHAAPAQVDFGRDIRPILSDRCFPCHGPDDAAREAGLRLDTAAGATADLGGYAAVVPGDPAASEMLRRLRADPDDRMPPPESGRTVSGEEIARLEAWIGAGARYDGHWSFAPLERPAVPPPAVAGTARGPIDHFIAARLVARGLAPSPEADRETLLRRVTFDLTGLPPTLEEIDAFTADRAAGAYDRVVDRLLRSPRFGERLASPWLDVARYADTYGYQNDRERRVWPWRDWVVAAFNADLPYDDFVTWQLAGDLLPEPTRAQRLATAFNRLHRQTNEGGSIEEEMRLEYVADRAETAATAFLGLTLGCARCHDHKFDPISQRDYYRFTAYFDNIDESGLYSHFTDAVPTPAMRLTTPAVDDLIAAQQRAVAATERALEALAATRRTHHARWRRGTTAPLRVAGLVAHYPFETVVEGGSPSTVGGASPARVAAGAAAVAGPIGGALALTGDDPITLPGVGAVRRNDPFSIALWVRAPRRFDRAVILHRSRAWTDAASQGYELLLEDGHLQASLIHFWPGNAASVRARAPLPTGRWVHVTLTHDGSARAGGLALYVDGELAPVAVVRDGLSRTITGGGPLVLTIGARFRDRGFQGGAVDEVRVYDRRLTAGEVAAVAGRAAAVAPSLEVYLEVVDPQWRRLAAELRGHRRRHADLLDAVPEMMVMAEMPAPRPTYLRARGRYDAPTERVEAGTPGCLPVPAGTVPRDRLGLARWLTGPRHPLTARVAVNRLWQIVFGRGLVATSDNFGSQGTPPSHPQLLDWLAAELVATGWSTKALLKQMVMSATYRQTSRPAGDGASRDPDNIWLGRAPRFRLPAEMVRDQALAASGLLVEQLGGAPARPYQPPGLWQEKGSAVYREDRGAGLFRRSLYTVWKRTSPPPAMMLFDAAKRDVCVTRRETTSTPLQALVLLDDPQYVEAARVLAERVVAAAPDRPERLVALFRILASRRPTDREQDVLRGLWDEAAAQFAAAPAAARALLGCGFTAASPAADPVELAAYTVVASTLFNHDATVTRR